MSSRRPGPLDYPPVSTTPSALPAPPLVLASKTTPVEARLTSSQATTQPLLPSAPRGEPQVEVKIFAGGNGGGTDGGSGSVESAASLLQSFKEDADLVAQKKRNGTFGRGSPSSTRKLTDSGSVNKRYVKMGILLSDSPTGVSPYRSHHHGNTGISSASGTSTPPFSVELGVTADSTNYSAGHSTYPVNQNSSFSNEFNHGSSSACPSSMVDVSIRPYMEEGAEHSENGVRPEDYEVIDLKDVGSIVDKTDRVTVSAQPSPPISMKSESTSINSEEPMSSPDSGYGNTPEYPNAGANEEVKTVEERCKNGVDLADGEERQRDSDGGAGATVEEAENGGNDETLQQDGRNREQLSRQSRGSSSSAVVSDSESRGQRSRGNTDESLFSAESIISSPDGVTAPSSRGGVTEDSQVFMRPRTKLYLGRQHSVPESVTAGIDEIKNTAAAITPGSQFSQLRHPMARGGVHTSPSTGSLSGFVHVSSSPNNRYSQPVMSSPLGFSELHPSHPSHPSRTLPRPPSGHSGKLTSSQSYQQIQRCSPELRRKKLRSSSIAFSKSTEVKLSRAIKSSTPSGQVPSEKDYFQVTDELSKENSHFALSEALLAVVEQYKANQFEQELELSSPRPPMSPLSPQPSLQSASTPGSMTDSPGSIGPAHPQWDTMSIASTSTTTGGCWTPPGSVGGTMPPWESFPSISTVDDPSESPAFPTQQRSHRISLLELISSPDNSAAESTAQRLLQHMATQLIGNESRENLNMSQMVLKLPTEFLTSLLLDEDLQKSVTTSSAHMRGNKEWAPPRNQIIYHIKTPSKNIHKDLAAQDYRCTGCGMKLEPSQARYFRFCTYTGRYFCHNCHTNATSIIPAYVMSRWSFKRYPVSNFARDLLLKYYSEPVFTAVPKDIYTKVPLMAQARDLRRQLVSIKSYLKTCRSAAPLNLTFEGYSPWTSDLTSYSLEDFVEIKAGMKMKHLRSMLSDAIAHVKRCPLCRGKGFVCEFCQNSNDIIFPFELHKIRKCRVCDCCFHKECYGKSQLSCPRCLRLQKRLKQRQDATASPTARDTSNNTSTNDYSSEVK